MGAEIKIGFTMHPRWLGDGDLSAFIEPLCLVGLSALEFELDQNLPAWPEFGPLMEKTTTQGLDLSFHAPFHPPHTLKGFSGSQREAIKQDYQPMLAVAEAWGKRLGSTRTVVIHAATSHKPADRDKLEADTLAFFTWALEAFPHICFALENNAPAKEDEVKIGERLEDVLRIIHSIENERLQACWDVGHDFMFRGSGDPPVEWLKAVKHVHVHDVNDQGVDHFPLIYQHVPHRSWLPQLCDTGRAEIAVLELKGNQLKTWEPGEIQAMLIGSIAAIEQAIH
jgi:sugar phosphate isomerase/epimerase